MFTTRIENGLTAKDIFDCRVQSPEVQVARLEMMLEVSRVFNSTLDLKALLQSVIQVTSQLTDTETTSILLLDKQEGDYYFEMTSDQTSAQPEPIAVPFEDSIAGWIVKNGEALVVDNIQHEERHFNEVEAMTPLAIQSVLGVPLITQDKTIGVIEVFNKRGRTGFTGDDIHTLNTLAVQAAAAIENIRFFEQRDRLDTIFNELQSPMSSIVGASQLMLTDSDLDCRKLRAELEHINREATRLSQMVNDFLELTRIETGRIQMDKRLLDLSALTQEVFDLFHPQALEKKITLSLNAKRAIPQIHADADRLRQVIVNLIDNAIKYNHEGGEVEVALCCNQVRVQVSVRDTGQGIPAKELGLVFDKFYRGPRDKGVTGGPGLGLSVARKIIEAHGGDIWVQSEVGAGSIFTFSLPLLETNT